MDCLAVSETMRCQYKLIGGWQCNNPAYMIFPMCQLHREGVECVSCKGFGYGDNCLNDSKNDRHCSFHGDGMRACIMNPPNMGIKLNKEGEFTN